MLSLQHLTVSLGSSVALRDVSLDVGPGEIVCIIGEEGSGKTTLLKLLTRELEPDEGVIKIDAAVLSQLPREVLRMYRERLGVLREDAYLDPTRTIAENVGIRYDVLGLPAIERDRAVQDLLKRLHLTGVGQRLPGSVSRGERQLAALAQAIAVGPAIILLDEPFQGIGDDTAKIAATMLQNMQKKGTSIIVATAEARTASFFSTARVITLRRGRLNDTDQRIAGNEDLRAEDIARAATEQLVERTTRERVELTEPSESEAPKRTEKTMPGKKIRITSVGSL